MVQPPPLWESPILQEAATALNCSLCPQDSNLSVHTDNPDLTPCFQSSLLAWVPCIYLWTALPCYLFYLRHYHRGYIVLSHLSRLKTVRGSGLNFGWSGDLGGCSPNSVAGQGSLTSLPGAGHHGSLPGGFVANGSSLCLGRCRQIFHPASPTLEKFLVSAQPSPQGQDPAGLVASGAKRDCPYLRMEAPTCVPFVGLGCPAVVRLLG